MILIGVLCHLCHCNPRVLLYGLGNLVQVLGQIRLSSLHEVRQIIVKVFKVIMIFSATSKTMTSGAYWTTNDNK